MSIYSLWFDVGIKRYTTVVGSAYRDLELWFDVGIKRYTTYMRKILYICRLWFDVGIKRYTTNYLQRQRHARCGLM